MCPCPLTQVYIPKETTSEIQITQVHFICFRLKYTFRKKMRHQHVRKWLLDQYFRILTLIK